jgi:long-chain acyl-CoA synthetase
MLAVTSRVRTVFTLLEEAATRQPNDIALHQPQPGGRQPHQTYTWRDFAEIGREIACGLAEIGLRKGDIVALHSETRAEFYFADFGIQGAGGIAAALYTNYPPAQLVETLRTCTAKLVFVDTPKSLKALLGAGGGELGVQWILLTGEAEGVLTLGDLRARGRAAMARTSSAFTTLNGSVSPEDYAILYLTSGATGEPKMGLVTHAALVANVDIGVNAADLTPNDLILAFLPSAHIAQRIGIELFSTRVGVQTYFSEGLTRLPHEMQSVRPTFFLAPPRVWERIYSSVCTEIKKRPAAMQRVFWGALGLSLKACQARQEGKSVAPWTNSLLALADKLVFPKLRARFGGRMRLPVSGAAPLGRDLAHFYEAIGMPIVEGYGLTEGGITTINPIKNPKAGSIGKMLDGVKWRITEDGELCLGGPTLFSGYFQDPHTTAQVLRDGWLHTGDIATVDENGFFYITGRKKEMIVSSNGKKIYPARIEGLLKMEPLISQMILVGDRRPYVSVLFTLNVAAAESLKGMEDMKGRPVADLAAAAPVQAALRAAISKANKQLASFEQVRKFRILDRDFTIEHGELTATMKVRRGRVLENCQNLVAEMYVGKDETD